MKQAAGMAFLLCSLLFKWEASGVTEIDVKQLDQLFAGIQSSEPGAAVLVLEDGNNIFERGYGVTDLRTLHRIDGHTNFRLASVTKQFTAMAIMLLVHDGKLQYDTRLTDIFPDFPTYGQAITIRNLLNHTSGILDYEDLMPKRDAKTPSESVPQIQDSEVFELLKSQKTTKFVSGTQWDYSNSGYVLLGVIVGKISGKPFGDFLSDRIFAPLNMSGTVAYQEGRNEVQTRAYGHGRDHGVWRQTDQSPTSATLGDGGVYSSLEDMAKWDRALRESTLISKAEMQAAITPVNVPGKSAVEPDGSPAEYGFGWFLNSYHGHTRMWHYGETIGFRTAIQRFTNEKLTIILFFNRGDMNPTAVALRIANLCLTTPR